MSGAENLPVWAALIVAAFLVAGALLTLIGAFGLIRFQTFYQRLHLPTLGTSFGTLFIIVSSMLFFSLLQTRLVVHELLIGSFVTVTTPVTLILIARAALYRDRSEGADGIPAFFRRSDNDPHGEGNGDAR